LAAKYNRAQFLKTKANQNTAGVPCSAKLVLSFFLLGQALLGRFDGAPMGPDGASGLLLTKDIS
jgi:hypothetical protein